MNISLKIINNKCNYGIATKENDWFVPSINTASNTQLVSDKLDIVPVNCPPSTINSVCSSLSQSHVPVSISSGESDESKVSVT